MKRIVFVNQTANYLFADILIAFATKLPDYSIEAWYGSFDYDVNTLPSNIKLSIGPEYDRSSFGKRFKSWVKFYLWMRRKFKAVDKKNTAFYFVSNPPLFVFLPGITKTNFDCLIYDLYPNVLGDLRKKAIVNFLAKRWENRNRKVFPTAQHIYTIGEGLKGAITQYLPERLNNKVQIIPVWNRSNGNITSHSKRDFRREWDLEGKKVILYSGNIGLTHPLEYLIELAKNIQQNTDWRIVIVGNGAKKMQLMELSAGLDNIIFQDPVPFNDLPALLSIATWGYVTLDSSATNTSVPSKTYNLLAAGIPLLAMVNEKSDIATLIDNYHVGLYFKEDSIKDAINKIVAISADEHNALTANAIKCSSYFTSELAKKFVDNWIAANV